MFPLQRNATHSQLNFRANGLCASVSSLISECDGCHRGPIRAVRTLGVSDRSTKKKGPIWKGRQFSGDGANRLKLLRVGQSSDSTHNYG